MILCHYLSPDTIVCPLAGSTKKDIIEQLAALLVQEHRLKHGDKILDAIMAREKAGSTFLPIGVAMPHARFSGIDEIKMVLGIIPEGMQESFEGESYPIYVVALFISPTSEQDFGRHLKLLARIAAVFHDVGMVKRLASVGSADEAFKLLQRFEREAEEAQSLSRREAADRP